MCKYHHCSNIDRVVFFFRNNFNGPEIFQMRGDELSCQTDSDMPYLEDPVEEVLQHCLPAGDSDCSLPPGLVVHPALLTLSSILGLQAASGDPVRPSALF